MPAVGTIDELRHAVDEVDVDALSLQADPSALDAARRSLDDSGLLLVGEVHGVRENPLIIRALLRALDIGGLGLEWHEELTPVVRAFLSGTALPDHPWFWSGDGRITAGHLALLRTMAAEGRPQPLLYDGTVEAGATWSERDRLMAERILAGDGDMPRLIVAGNLHTRTRRIRAGVPMGSHLRRERSGVREIRIVYRGGRFYNDGTRDFSGVAPTPRGPGGDRGPGLYERRGQLHLELPEASEAVVPHRPLPPPPANAADPEVLVGMVRLDDLPPSAQPARHVDPHRVEAMLTIFDSLPPVTVFETPDGLLVADGYHRLAAARRLGREWITIAVRRGSRHEALAFAVENARRERGLSAEEVQAAIGRWSLPGPEAGR